MYKAKLTHAERRLRRERVLDALRQGDSIDAIAARFGVGKSFVVATIRQKGIPGKIKAPKAMVFAVLKVLLNKTTDAEAAEIFHVSRQYISQIRQAAIEGGWTVLKY